MPRAYDAIVVGLGAMGSAALRALSRRGWRALGLDRFAPPHDRGSSHGQSRIIREAYFEDPSYVPLVQRACLLWEELERESGKKLLLPTGGLMIGPPDGVLVAGALRSAREHRLAHECLDASALRKRFPIFHAGEGVAAVWEPRAGVLAPEASIEAFLATARRHGAQVRTNEPALSWKACETGVQVTTARGRYTAGHLILSAGAWMPGLLRDPVLPLAVERVFQLWFDPASDAAAFAPERCPVWIWEHERDRFLYGFPISERGIKLARHHEGESADPDHVRREVSDAEVAEVRTLIARCVPAAGGALRAAAVCLYTNTPDSHFIIDQHPLHPAVLIVSACSGHGFKFAPVIGEIVSDWAVDGIQRFDLERFRVGR
jgi:sarcosine oxidase